ncbi:MAG: type II secretion system minor pseudopilin GspI [Burkholderiales bacterium]
MKSSSERRRGPAPGGFTLVEVLVALTIVAVALIASLRAVGSLSTSAFDLRQRTLAQWSAENRLAQIRVQDEWPALGQRAWDCSQAEAGLVCEEAVFATPNAQFRRVEVSVFPSQGTRVRLARLVGFATNAGGVTRTQ